MKKIVIFLSLILTVFSSYAQQKATNLDKAKTLIKKELYLTLNDFNSYQPVSYSKVEKLYTDPFEDEQIQKEYNELNSYKDKTGEWSKYLSLNDTITTDSIYKSVMKLGDYASEKKLYSSAQSYFEIASKLQMYKFCQFIVLKSLNQFKPEFIGMKVIHKYRAKNSLGGYVLKTAEFRFNKNMTVIIKVVDLD